MVQGQSGATGKKLNRPAPTQSLYCISNGGANVPATPFLCEVRLLPSWTTPAGWSACKGQLLPLNINQAMFSLLGFTFGGDGRQKLCFTESKQGACADRVAILHQRSRNFSNAVTLGLPPDFAP